jgi:hypothetical protein
MTALYSPALAQGVITLELQSIHFSRGIVLLRGLNSLCAVEQANILATKSV